MLNLGCGTKMHCAWNNLDFGPYARLCRYKWIVKYLRPFGFISEKRYQRLQEVDPNIILWDLRRGIPFGDKMFDVVYHSHFLEHIDRFSAHNFLKECYRVLKLKGVLRVVVPDLEVLIKNYIENLQKLRMKDWDSIDDHEKSIEKLFEQMVRKKSVGVSENESIMGKIEAIIRGGAERTGELHQWMYDEFSLKRLLANAGFVDVTMQSKDKSFIKDWDSFKLDITQDRAEYKIGSLYIEAKRT